MGEFMEFVIQFLSNRSPPDDNSITRSLYKLKVSDKGITCFNLHGNQLKLFARLMIMTTYHVWIFIWLTFLMCAWQHVQLWNSRHLNLESGGKNGATSLCAQLANSFIAVWDVWTHAVTRAYHRDFINKWHTTPWRNLTAVMPPLHDMKRTNIAIWR